jgi:hypothetical protein
MRSAEHGRGRGLRNAPLEAGTVAFVTGTDAASATVAFAARFCALKTATVQSVNSAATAEEYGTSPGHIARILMTPSSTDDAAFATLTQSSAASAAVAAPRLTAIERGLPAVRFARVPCWLAPSQD